MEKTQYNHAFIFAGLPISDEEKFRVGEEIKKLGGLTFSVSSNEDGWLAQCHQVEGIIAAGTNTAPTNAEVEAEIRQAIISAFNVEVIEPMVESPFKFEYGTTPQLVG